jgi:hypothetical protein
LISAAIKNESQSSQSEREITEGDAVLFEVGGGFGWVELEAGHGTRSWGGLGVGKGLGIRCCANLGLNSTHDDEAVMNGVPRFVGGVTWLKRSLVTVGVLDQIDGLFVVGFFYVLACFFYDCV